MNASIGPRPPLPSDLPLIQVWNDVLELLPDAVFIISGGDDGGTIRYVNSQASRMFGYERSELIDQSIDLLVPSTTKQDHRRHRDDYMSAPSLRPMGAGLALHGRRHDGSEFPIDVLLKPTYDIAVPGIIAVVRDMTERETLEEALTQARDSALRANEVKSRFLAAASHDLRQPLQTIWSLQALLSRVHANTEYAPQCALLEDAVRSMDQMLSSLIDINRLEKGAIQPVIRDFPLEEILPRLRSEFGYAASSKSLILDIEDSTEFARSDPMLLPVIIRNLLGNAIKYTQRGSIRLRVRSEDATLVIDIIDTGPGIGKEHLERLFDAFYQIDNQNRDQERGVGLGLSIVQTICRLLDHTVSIKSEFGQGSTFTLRLPRGLATDLPIELASPPVVNTPRPAGSVTVLHIEDDPGVSLSMTMLLQLEGYKVVSAATRDEALQHIEVNGVRPDLVLCDFNLPMGFTGDQIIAEIAIALGYKPPTIMLTGDIAERHVARAKLVAERIFPKPVDINRLLREIDNLLNTRH
jgi:two-component system, sensor histidine kinase